MFRQNNMRDCGALGAFTSRCGFGHWFWRLPVVTWAFMLFNMPVASVIRGTFCDVMPAGARYCLRAGRHWVFWPDVFHRWPDKMICRISYSSYVIIVRPLLIVRCCWRVCRPLPVLPVCCASTVEIMVNSSFIGTLRHLRAAGMCVKFRWAWGKIALHTREKNSQCNEERISFVLRALRGGAMVAVTPPKSYVMRLPQRPAYSFCFLSMN